MYETLVKFLKDNLQEARIKRIYMHA